MQARSSSPKTEAMRQEILRQKAQRPAVQERDGEEDDVMEDTEMHGLFRNPAGLPSWAYMRKFADVLDNSVFDQK